MSQLSNYSENEIADFVRGQGATGIAAITNFYIGLATAASDSSITECSGSGYARQSYARSLAQWAGTQGSGTTLASSGTSHATSNNSSISFGTSGAAWGTATHAVLYSASTGGNVIAYCQLPSPISIGSGVPVSLPAGAISLTLGLTGGLSNFFSNKLIDFIFRGQAYTMPANLFFGLFTTAPTNAGGGVEVSGGSYARQSLPATLAGLSGTQAAGSATASSGTGGRISNNLVIAFPTPTANWGTITAEAVFDASSAGNLLFWNVLDEARTVLSGSSPQTHAADTWDVTFA